MHGHIKWLLNKGIKTIFYPCVSYEENFVPNTDNHYNCPVVANYPVVIGANMPELREEGVRYMRPTSTWPTMSSWWTASSRNSPGPT